MLVVPQEDSRYVKKRLFLRMVFVGKMVLPASRTNNVIAPATQLASVDVVVVMVNGAKTAILIIIAKSLLFALVSNVYQGVV